MVWKRAAAGMVLAGGLLAGCQQSHTPKASVAAAPVDESTVANLEQSYRAAHPDALIGHVNAVEPSRHILSVAGLPTDQIHGGDVASILAGGQSSNPISATVYDKASGYVQMDYGQLQSGQPEPRIGDLAVRFPGGASMPPSVSELPSAVGGAPVTTAPATTQPGTAPEMPAAPTTPPPAPPVTPPTTSPDTTTPPPTTPPPTTPPATTTPATSATDATPPATAPATTTPAPGATETPAPTTPPPAPPTENKVPADLNK